MFEVNECVSGPEMLSKFFASDEFAWTFQQKREDGDKLALQLELRAMLKQLARLAVEFERSETHPMCGWKWQVYPTVATTKLV